MQAAKLSLINLSRSAAWIRVEARAVTVIAITTTIDLTAFDLTEFGFNGHLFELQNF